MAAPKRNRSAVNTTPRVEGNIAPHRSSARPRPSSCESLYAARSFYFKCALTLLDISNIERLFFGNTFPSVASGVMVCPFESLLFAFRAVLPAAFFAAFRVFNTYFGVLVVFLVTVVFTFVFLVVVLAIFLAVVLAVICAR